MEQHNLSISNFRQFLFYYILPFVVITTLLLYCLGLLFEKKIILEGEIGGAYKLNQMLHSNSLKEIPIIGSSRAQGGYIPDSISPLSFNYGIDGIGMNIHLLFIEKEAEKQKNTPLIINVDMEGFYRSRGDIMNYLYNSSDPEVKKIVGKDFSFINYVPVLKYYGYFEWYFKYYLNQRINFTKKTNKGGSFELNIPSKQSFDQNIEERLKTLSQFVNDSVLEAQLEKLIIANPTRVFYFVVAPYHKSYLKVFTNKVEFNNYFKDLEKYTNVKFFNFSEMPLSDDCFFNTTHINFKGAQLFSVALRDSLQLNDNRRVW